ncbi:MAG TPA: hypothetical protein PLI22_00665 [Caldisericia bacterium]|jgi:hypothetical protein|nr:hypothetical protein [Caldisericia bacterium]
MKQMLTRERIFELYYVLQNGIPADVKLDKRFDFARNRTLDNLRPEVREIIKARETGLDKFKEFEMKRKAILEENCIRDENGKPLLKNDSYVFSDDIEKDVSQKLLDLTNEYKDALEERQKEIQIYNEIIKEEIEVDIVKTTFRAFPDLVNNNFTKILRPMIKETDEEIEQILME